MNPAAPVTRTFILSWFLPFRPDGPRLRAPPALSLRAHGRVRALLPIPVGIHTLPPPGIPAHVVDPEHRLPAEHPLGERGVRVGFGHVAGPPRHLLGRDRPAARALERAHRLEHRDSAPGAEVDREPATFTAQRFQRGEVSPGEVHDVDIVADTGAVTRRVVAAEYPHAVARPHRDLGDIR